MDRLRGMANLIPILANRLIRRRIKSPRAMRPNPAVNTDRHRRAFGRAWRPVTFIR